MTPPMGADDTAHVVALWRLQSTYADIVTRRAWSELPTVFRQDVRIHLDTVTAEPRTLVGSDAFAAFVGPAMERFDHFTFVILNTVVEVDEVPATPSDSGTGRGRLFMCEVRHDRASDTWQNAHGMYEDHYAFEGGRWWIARRAYRSMARTGPDATILGLPPGLGPLGR